LLFPKRKTRESPPDQFDHHGRLFVPICPALANEHWEITGKYRVKLRETTAQSMSKSLLCCACKEQRCYFKIEKGLAGRTGS